MTSRDALFIHRKLKLNVTSVTSLCSLDLCFDCPRVSLRGRGP